MVNLLEFLSGDMFRSAMHRLHDNQPLSPLDRETIQIGVRSMIEKIGQDVTGLPQIRPEGDEVETELFRALWVANPGAYICLYVDDFVHIHVLMMRAQWEVPNECKVAFHITNDDDKSYNWISGNLNTVAEAWRLLKERPTWLYESIADTSDWLRTELSTARGGPPAHARRIRPNKPNSSS